MTDIIYYMANNLKVCKIGSTRNIIAKMATYSEMSIDSVIPTYYYKINKNCYEIDKLIQLKFKKFCVRFPDLYDLAHINNKLLEDLFKDNNIKFEKYNGIDIKDEIGDKIINMTDNDYFDIMNENKIKTQLK